MLQRLSKDLTKHFGRGFGVDNLQRMRAFYLEYKPESIYATVSRKSKEEDISSEKYATLSRISVEQIHQIKSKTASRIFTLEELAKDFGFAAKIKVKDEIAKAWADAQDLWRIFKRQKERVTESEYGTAETRKNTIVEKMGNLYLQSNRQ